MLKFLLYISCVLAVLSDMLMVLWAKNSKHPIWYLIVAIVLIIATWFFWLYPIYKGFKISIAISLYAIFSIIGCCFVGIVIYHEQLSIINIIGIVLGLIALIMVSI